MNDSTRKRGSLLERAMVVLRAERAVLHPRLRAVNLAAGLLPPHVGNSIRVALMRRAGFEVADGAILADIPQITGAGHLFANLSFGAHCLVETGCTFDLLGKVSIGERATIGQDVMLLTASHELGPRERRAGNVTTGPITIERGAWIGPRCIILPGVTIGEGAIVNAGAVVTKDVAPHTRVGGSPARQLETLQP